MAEDKGRLCECANCGEQFGEDELAEISDFRGRIAAGEEMPAGECPKCGSLCHLVNGGAYSSSNQGRLDAAFDAELDPAYLSVLAGLARDTIEELVGPGEDKHYFEIDDLTSLDEISEGSDGTWVRGWILVDNSQLEKAGLKDADDEEDDDDAD